MSASSPLNPRLVGVRAKIDRAKHHIHDLESQIAAFREIKPYRLLRETDPQTGEHVFRVRVCSQPPRDFALIAGEAVHQLRSSLDHLAWQLVDVNKNAPGKHTYFPIYEDTTRYKAQSAGKVKGMSPTAISLIDTIQPYQGGNPDLWILHELNNFDKHRLLLVVAFGFHNLSVISGQEGTASRPRVSFKSTVSVRDPSGRFPIIQDGAVMLRLNRVEGSQMNDNFNLSFEIAFGEPKVVQGQPVVPLLNQFADTVESVVMRFAHLL